jgi:peptidoglycan hydrolase-like protein with peptidoglycan-binding domain
MKHRKWILTAVILSGSLGLGVQYVSAQERPMGKQPDQAIPEKVQSSPSGIQSQGMAGISADDIKKAKEALKAKGLNPGPMDGTLDSKTQQALREFQQANKLPVTGALDQQTAEKLGVTTGGSGQKSSTQQRGQDSSLPKAKGGME